MKDTSHFMTFKTNWTKHLIIAISILLLVFTAIKSHGYYHADEHYQIIEFAGVKLNTHTTNEMVWEYSKRIRPTLQPTIAYTTITFFKTIGINDPYNQTLVLRLLTATLAIFVLLYFNRHFQIFIRQSSNEIVLLLLTFFIWFLPFLMVRFSSETWSGLLFVLGLTLILKSLIKPKYFIIGGLVLGFSFLFRYQIGFCILGLLIWILFAQKVQIISILQILLGIAIVVIVGIAIDTWFYGQFTIAPWRFLTAVFSTAGEGFGESPWYFYFKYLISEPHYLLSAPILLVILFGFIKQKSSLLIWCISPFILFHLFIPHKEIRFFFPIAFLAPALIYQGIMPLVEIAKKRKYLNVVGFVIVSVFLVINFSALAINTQKPAGKGRTAITEYIHNNYKNQSIHLTHTPWQNPYNPWNSIPLKFYAESDLQSTQIKSIYDITDSIIQKGKVNLLVISIKSNIESDKVFYLEKSGFKKVCQNMPSWVYDIIKFVRPKADIKLIVLYEGRVK